MSAPPDRIAGSTAGDPPARLHALDALRATAMELGIVLHAGVPYTRGCPDTWAVCDASRSIGFDLLNTLIHAFRMPVFFLMSGFFAALLLARVGEAGFVRHRLRRIALPLLAACAILVPLTRAIWIYGAFADPSRAQGGRFVPSVLAHFEENGIRVLETIWHLWFLEYLLLFYAAYLLLRAVAGGPLGALGDRLAPLVLGRWRALWLAIPVGLWMGTMQTWNVDGIGELRPAIHMLVYYGIFFAAGLLLYRHRERIDALARGWNVHLALALAVAFPALLLASRLQQQVDPAVWTAVDALGRGLSGLLTCLLLYGIVGFFVERLASASPVQRYLSDAAYWVYLCHFPLIAFLGIALAPLAWPAPLKFAAVLVLAVPLLLALYQVGVRRTFIGRTLHGPR